MENNQQQQQPQLTWEEYKKQQQQEREREELNNFKKRMIGKNHKKLSITELNWIYKNNRLIYENLITDREYVVPNHI